jgi:hypothetical protein
VEALERATNFMFGALKAAPNDVLAGATPYLRLFGYARGGTALAKGALAAQKLASSGATDPMLAARIAIARFFAEHIATGSLGLELSVTEGSASVEAGAFALTF